MTRTLTIAVVALVFLSTATLADNLPRVLTPNNDVTGATEELDLPEARSIDEIAEDLGLERKPGTDSYQPKKIILPDQSAPTDETRG